MVWNSIWYLPLVHDSDHISCELRSLHDQLLINGFLHEYIPLNVVVSNDSTMSRIRKMIQQISASGNIFTRIKKTQREREREKMLQRWHEMTKSMLTLFLNVDQHSKFTTGHGVRVSLNNWREDSTSFKLLS